VAALIGLDWGTSSLRAALIDRDGTILERFASPHGITNLPEGGYEAAFAEAVGAWREPGLPVLASGMVGARTGWQEAPYVPCPGGAAEIAASLLTIRTGDGGELRILPGMSFRNGAGVPDVMRGEETQILGCLGDGGQSGLFVLPGTHSKWVRVEAGRIAGFATYVTGELFGVLREHAFIARLAEEPEDPAGFAEGLAAARREGGLTRRLFETRTRVLDGAMPGTAVRPFLSGMLIGAELLGAAELYDLSQPVRIVADGVLGEAYSTALAARGIPASRIEPERAFVAGLAAVDAALKEPA
jgi:2-dehydro-3-deoxygalactonokinase